MKTLSLQLAVSNMMTRMWLLLRILSTLTVATAYTMTGMQSPSFATPRSFRMSTTVAPPAIDTEKGTRRKNDDKKESYDDEYIRKNGPIEYLEDDLDQSRDLKDPFHILLLAETYLNPKVTVNYVSGSLQFVLDMPYEDSVDAAIFAKEQGMSCVGTWTREECLELGKALQQRDLCVRVVPFVPGGQRAWQANKDASDQSNARNNRNGDFGGGGDFIDADYEYESSN